MRRNERNLGIGVLGGYAFNKALNYFGMKKRKFTRSLAKKWLVPQPSRFIRPMGGYSAGSGAFKRYGPGMRHKNYSTGIPKRMYVNFKTVKPINVAPATTSTTYLAYMNSLFQPMGTYGAAQPVYFDQLKALYNFYYCRQGQFTLKYTNETANGVVVVMSVDRVATQPTTLDGACSMPGATFAVARPDDGIVTLKKTFNIDNWKFEYHDTQAPVTASPTDIVYLHISLWSQDSSGSPGNITGNCIMTAIQQSILFDRVFEEDA